MIASKHGLWTLVAVALMSGGCSSGSDSNSTSSGGGGSTATVGAIAVSASPTAVTMSGTSSIQATVTTTTGGNAADGTRITFSLSNPSMGTLSSTSATTTNGVATVSFTASTTPGTVSVKAAFGAVNGTVAITVAPPPNATIEFSSATPTVLGVQGSGQAENSLVTFLVKDVNGSPVTAGQVVSFEMVGPSGGKQPAEGGEYIGTDDGTPTTASGVTDANGRATVRLNAGKVAGPVTIRATVATPTGTVSTSSSPLSIGGGVPSASHFNIATSKLNLPGLVVSGATAEITAFIADRFSNYNILTGTSVSFYTEAGAIDRSDVTDATGKTTVTLRTQDPTPYLFAPAGDPRNGHVTVLATVAGEETFYDANGNGLYDVGEAFTDTPGEPFIDRNDNGAFDDGEFYVDINGNGIRDGGNGVWDGPGCSATGCRQQTMLWDTLKIAFTGHIENCTLTPTTYSVASGGSQPFTFTFGDLHNNVPLAGTKVDVTTTKGTLAGTTSYTVPDAVGGPGQINFTLLDPDSDSTIDASSVTVKVTPPSGSAILACPDTVATGTVQ